MWTSSLLKHNGWNSVKSHYWTAFGVMLLMSIISGAASYAINIPLAILMNIFGIDEDTNFILWFILIIAVSIILSGCIIGILETGKSRYFYRARTGDVDLGNLFWAFQGGRYASTAKIMFWRYLEIMLWSLLTCILFCIPGMIKAYEYILVPYLLAENPNFSKERVFEISKRTMHGEKMRCFVLQFSFIGWFILGAIVCWVGEFAVLPYYEATMAEFYACMRAKAIAMCITTEEELTNNYDNYGSYGRPYDSYVNPYESQNPYQQSPYQNPNPYESQNPYQQNPNPYESNPYQNPDSGENHKVNLKKDSDDDNLY